MYVAHRRLTQLLMLCHVVTKPNIRCCNCNGDLVRANCPQKQQAAASQDRKAAEVSVTCGKCKCNKFKTDQKDQTGFNVALVNRKVFSASRFIRICEWKTSEQSCGHQRERC